MPETPDTAPVPYFEGFAAVADRYDAFILDVWGVLHDGVTLYPGVVDTLEHLTAAEKPFVLLTNAPRRSAAVAEAMIEMGMPAGFCRRILSSGEATYLSLKERSDPFYARIGNRFLHTGPDRDRGLFEGLEWEETSRIEDCDLIVNTGPWEDSETVPDYEELLQKGAELGLPMICANPDLEVVRGGRKIICAGALALRYEELGGGVRWFGKPKAEIYAYCFRVLSGIDKTRIAAVGDSFRTDLAGAKNVGVDPVLVVAGVHTGELGGLPPDPASLNRLALEWNVRPVASVPAFVW
ncbi:MAG: TIGR01459 family HAD-type hydrolase [Pseudomonadota bacterium]|nr:TIGR01459 family HAD-type hydrolase [Pseudomonadota bacterium]